MNTLYDLPGRSIADAQRTVAAAKVRIGLDADPQERRQDGPPQQPDGAGDGRRRRKKDGCDPARAGIRTVLPL